MMTATPEAEACAARVKAQGDPVLQLKPDAATDHGTDHGEVAALARAESAVHARQPLASPDGAEPQDLSLGRARAGDAWPRSPCH